MAEKEWIVANREAILRRIRWLNKKTDGIFFDRSLSLHRIIIRKEGSRIQLFFSDPNANNMTGETNGSMSEYDLSDPLNLVVTYYQAFLLPLLWNNDPKRVYMIGLGGGCISMVLHHYFPNLILDNSDIDPDVPMIAKRFFGFQTDRRQRVFIRDGREYLAERHGNVRYDFILIDAFRGLGYGSYHLSTLNFYQLCKDHLNKGGIVVTNLLGDDVLFLEKINTFRNCFNRVYIHFDPGFIETYVLLGTDTDFLDESGLIERANSIQNDKNFPFPFVKRATDLKPLDDQSSYLMKFGQTDMILTDDCVPLKLINSLSSENSIFYKAKLYDPCPCGSGNIYIYCHRMLRQD